VLKRQQIIFRMKLILSQMVARLSTLLEDP
jgi:hypothetical protein